MTTLPAGWQLFELGDVVEIVRGVTYDKTDARAAPATGLLPILRANNITDAGLAFDDLVYVPTSCISSTQRLRVHDIVMAASSGSRKVVGKSARLGEAWDGSFGAFCYAIRPCPQIDPRFVGYYMQSPSYRQRVSDLAAGVNINNLRREHIAQQPLECAPIQEQGRIVAKLDAIFEQTRASKARLERLPALLEKLKRSILAAAFRGDLTSDWRAANPDGERDLNEGSNSASTTSEQLPSLPTSWTWSRLDQEARFVTSGSRGWAEFYSDDGPLFLRVGNLSRSGVRLKFDDIQRVRPPAGAEGERTRVVLGDVLVSITADIGRVGVIDEGVGEAYVNQHVALCRPVDATMGPFLAYSLLNPDGFQRFLRGAQYGMTKAALSLEQVRAAPIALPPPAERKVLVERIEAALHALDAMKDRVVSEHRRLTTVEQAALAKAFRGELVAQDPSDEPASVLLDRIGASRTAAPAKRSRGRAAKREQPAPPTPADTTASGTEAPPDNPLDLVVAVFQLGTPRLTASTIIDVTGLRAKTVTSALKALVDAGQVRVHGRAKGTTYEWRA